LEFRERQKNFFVNLKQLQNKGFVARSAATKRRTRKGLFFFFLRFFGGK
jgi:hypothetical protein